MEEYRIAEGGSAGNPPHLGHLALGEALLNCGLFDVVRWRPSGDRHDKTIGVSADARVAMTNLSFPAYWLTRAGTRWVVRFSDVYGDNTPTIDILEQQQQKYPKRIFTWYTGADSVIPQKRYGGKCEIEAKWLRGAELMANWPFLIILRSGYSEPRNLPDNFSILKVVLPDISSSDIRRRIAAGKPFRHLVTPGVAEYIKMRGLYGYKRN